MSNITRNSRNFYGPSAPTTGNNIANVKKDDVSTSFEEYKHPENHKNTDESGRRVLPAGRTVFGLTYALLRNNTEFRGHFDQHELDAATATETFIRNSLRVTGQGTTSLQTGKSKFNEVTSVFTQAFKKRPARREPITEYVARAKTDFPSIYRDNLQPRPDISGAFFSPGKETFSLILRKKSLFRTEKSVKFTEDDMVLYVAGKTDLKYRLPELSEKKLSKLMVPGATVNFRHHNDHAAIFGTPTEAIKKFGPLLPKIPMLPGGSE